MTNEAQKLIFSGIKVVNPRNNNLSISTSHSTSIGWYSLLSMGGERGRTGANGGERGRTNPEGLGGEREGNPIPRPHGHLLSSLQCCRSQGPAVFGK